MSFKVQNGSQDMRERESGLKKHEPNILIKSLDPGVQFVPVVRVLLSLNYIKMFSKTMWAYENEMIGLNLTAFGTIGIGN